MRLPLHSATHSSTIQSGDSGAISDAERRVGVAVLLVDTLLMNLGFGILVPLVAIHFTGSLGFTAAAIGLVLALRQLTQQGLDLIGGIIADHVGARNSIALGCFLRAVGFLGMGAAATFGPLLWWAIVAGIGGAFFDAPGTAAMADLAAPEERQQVFAVSATLGNVGATIGPLVGVVLLTISFAAVSGVAAACFGVLGIATMVWLPVATLRRSAGMDKLPERHTMFSEFGRTLRLLAHDRPFVWLTVLLAGFWFIWAQINITIPLVAADRGGTGFAAQVLALNAGLSILLQYPLNRLAIRWCSHRTLLSICTAVAAGGMALAFVSPSIPMLLVGVVVFALGRMVMTPLINVVTADFAPKGKLGAYFGFGALSIAVGAGGGQFVGGLLYDTALSTHQTLQLWGSMLLVGTIVALGVMRLRLPDQAPRSRAKVVDAQDP